MLFIITHAFVNTGRLNREKIPFSEIRCETMLSPSDCAVLQLSHVDATKNIHTVYISRCMHRYIATIGACQVDFADGMQPEAKRKKKMEVYWNH